MGAPEGNTNARRGFEATRALESVLLKRAGLKPEAETISRFTALELIWEKQLDKATGELGDIDNQSAQMIIDRLEGKPRQSVDATISNPDGTNMSISFNGVESDGRRKDTD